MNGAAAHAVRLARHWPLALLLVFYATNQLWWFLCVPLGQAPDEPDHADYVNYLVEKRALPRLGETRQSRLMIDMRWWTVRGGDRWLLVDPRDPTRGRGEDALKTRPPHESWVFDSYAWQAEAGQPPLYYIAPAVLIAPARNRITGITRWQLVRVFSVVCGLLGVLAAWSLGRRLWPARPSAGGFLLAGWMVLHPMASFIRSVASNDALASSIAAAFFLALCHWPRATPRRALACGALVGLALLTKASALALVPVALLWAAAGARGPLERLRAAALVAMAAAGLFVPYVAIASAAGAWHYTDFIGKIFPRLANPIHPSAALGLATESLFVDSPDGFFGRYAWHDIERPPAGQLASLAILVVGLGGLALSIGRTRLRRRAVRIAAALLLVLAGMVAWSGYHTALLFGTTTIQGRFFLILLLPIGVLVLEGWRRVGLLALGPRGALFCMVLPLAVLGILDIHDQFLLVADLYLAGAAPPLLGPENHRFLQNICVNLPAALKLPGLWEAAYWLHLASAAALLLAAAILARPVAAPAPGVPRS